MTHAVGLLPTNADCEDTNGAIAQDVNSWTSIGFLAGAAVLVVALLAGRARRATWVLVGSLALEGVGSIMFHGRPSDVAQVLHDAGLLALLGFVAGWHVGRLRPGGHDLGSTISADRLAVAGAAVGAALGCLVLVAPALSTLGTAALAFVVVVAERVARRRGRVPVWRLGLVVLGGLAVATWFAGRSDSPTCDPGSWMQWHGLWHLMSALVVLAWADVTMGRRGDGRLEVLRDTIDRTLGLAARLLVRGFHRAVDTIGERPGLRVPTLVVANHGNGFVDPVVVASALGRLPRFLAKSTLWKVLPARPLLALAGVVPVHRASDGATGANTSTFSACHEVLARGGCVAIFPEGTTGDRARLDTVRTGAARIALGALSTAPDLVVLPVGLAYESRTRTRSRAVTMWAPPIELSAWVRASGRDPATISEDDHAAVDELTEEIRADLVSVSPEFASVDEREYLRDAAAIACRGAGRGDGRGGRSASFGEIEVQARRMADAPRADRDAVIDALARYTLRLTNLGIADADIAPGVVRSVAARLTLAAAIVAVLGPLVTLGVVVHLPVVLLVTLLTGWVRSTATKGTVRVLVGALGGLVTWVIGGAVLADGWQAVLAGVGLAVLGAVALGLWTLVSSSWSRVLGALRVRDRIRLVETALDDRAALCAAVERASVRAGAPLDERSDAPSEAGV
jgi:1-acyl-sn-glycerol-3-phosphate acyltransferase